MIKFLFYLAFPVAFCIYMNASWHGYAVAIPFWFFIIHIAEKTFKDC